MNTAPAETVSQLRDLALANLAPGPWQPRKRRDPKAQAELENSVRKHGVVSPIAVRAAAKGPDQIIAGEGRYLAAKAAGFETIPARVFDGLSDQDCYEIALIENIQRSDLHPIDEAETFGALLKLERKHTTVESIANQIGKSPSYVKRRMKLLSLPAEVREACLEGVITAKHAELLAALPKELKSEAFIEGCFLEIPFDREIEGQSIEKLLAAKNWAALRQESASVGHLQGWIDQAVKHDLTDEALQERLPELAGAIVQESQRGRALVEVSDSHYLSEANKKLGLITRDEYHAIRGPKDSCPSAERAVVTHGGRPRGPFDICRDKACKKHHAREAYDGADRSADAGKPRKKSKWELEEEARRKKVRAYGLLKGAALRAMVPQIQKAKLTAAVVKNMLRPYELKEVSRRFGLELKADGSNALAILIANHLDGEAFDRSRMTSAAKVIGFDLGKFERTHVKEQLAKKQAAAAAYAKEIKADLAKNAGAAKPRKGRRAR